MELYFAQFLTISLFIVLFLFIFKCYWNFKKVYSGFPLYHFMPYYIYCYMTGKISKDNTITKVRFEKIMELGKQYMEEGLFLSFGVRPTLCIFGEAAVKTFMNSQAVVDKPPEYWLMAERSGNGLITSNGKRWRLHRKIINPAFQLSVLKEKVPVFNEHALNLIKDMEMLVEEPYVDILDLLKYHYFNSLSESVFGLKQSKENKAEIQRFSESLDRGGAFATKRFFLPWLRSKFFLKMFSSGRQYFQDLKEDDEFISKIISQMKTRFSSEESVDTEIFSVHLCKSFAHLLLNQHLKDPTFTIKDVRDEVKTITLAGYKSVAYSTMWCLFLLGLYPDIQEKVYDEVLTQTSDYITHEETTNLSYLESVILEAQRIYTVVPLILRYLSEDVVYDKYKVPKGTTIMFAPCILHKNPKIYPDPEEFMPERFLNAETKRSAIFIPFAEGKRSCIGKYYALLEMKIFLAHILRNFKIMSLDKREDVGLCHSIVLTPVKPLRMKITLRHKKPL